MTHQDNIRGDARANGITYPMRYVEPARDITITNVKTVSLLTPPQHRLPGVLNHPV